MNNQLGKAECPLFRPATIPPPPFFMPNRLTAVESVVKYLVRVFSTALIGAICFAGCGLAIIVLIGLFWFARFEVWLSYPGKESSEYFTNWCMVYSTGGRFFLLYSHRETTIPFGPQNPEGWGYGGNFQWQPLGSSGGAWSAIKKAAIGFEYLTTFSRPQRVHYVLDDSLPPVMRQQIEQRVILENRYRLWMPAWPILFLLGVTPVMRVRKGLLACYRRRFHLCISCGYDLRCSYGRCPECGSEGEGAENGRSTLIASEGNTTVRPSPRPDSTEPPATPRHA